MVRSYNSQYESVLAALSDPPTREQYTPASRYSSQSIDALVQRYHEKENARIAVRDVILASAGKWVGAELSDLRFPIVRNSEVVRWLDASESSRFVDGIIYAGMVPPIAVLKTEKQQLERLLTALESVVRSLDEIDIEFSSALHGTWSDQGWSYGEPVDIIHAVGLTTALDVSIHGTITNVRRRLLAVDAELSAQPRNVGNKPNRPAYAAAKSFAELYAAMLGAAPTLSVSDSMYTGKFSPALRDLFDAFGWEKTDIRGPAKAAIEAISADYIRSFEPPPPQIGLLGAILELGKKLPDP